VLNTFVVHVENNPDVVTRVVSIFRRRAFKLCSLTMGRTEKPDVSHITFTMETDEDQARRVEDSLHKLVNVLLVENITHKSAIVRELALFKVAVTNETRSAVLELVSEFRAHIVDVTPDSLTIEITSTEDKIDGLFKALGSVGLEELARGGIVAMCRDTKITEPTVG
jgi:acetolactate synthase-1/3 small subunit